MSAESLRVAGTLPDDPRTYDASVAVDSIALRVGDRICVAHPTWMSDNQARVLVTQLAALTEGGSR
jgi:hypothetical protein